MKGLTVGPGRRTPLPRASRRPELNTMPGTRCGQPFLLRSRALCPTPRNGIPSRKGRSNKHRVACQEARVGQYAARVKSTDADSSECLSPDWLGARKMISLLCESLDLRWTAPARAAVQCPVVMSIMAPSIVSNGGSGPFCAEGGGGVANVDLALDRDDSRANDHLVQDCAQLAGERGSAQ